MQLHATTVTKLFAKATVWFLLCYSLQPTVLSQNDGFYPVTHNSVQIHHTGQFHWGTSCSICGWMTAGLQYVPPYKFTECPSRRRRMVISF